MIEQLQETTDYLIKRGVKDPQIGVILGTGLGSQFIEKMEVLVTVDYEDIPHFPEATVLSHEGKLFYGVINGKKVVALSGRFHFYEGYSMQQITMPVRVLKLLGIKQLLLSNAAGNMNLNWKKGELMLIDDHINLQPDNPLRGPNDEKLGSRFPDMSAPYDLKLNDKLKAIAKDRKIALREGVYVAVMGPNLETRAEYRFLKNIGADVVGMSTVPEVIVANHMELPCCAISILTDDCDPDNLKPVNIAEIIEIAGKAEVDLTELYIDLIHKL